MIDIAGKGKDVVERMIDQISGDMVLLDLSRSSLLSVDDIYEDDSDSDSGSAHSDEEITRRVSFSEDLVCDVWERPYTTLEEKPQLFYSGKEIWAFRLEYRAIIRNRKAQRHAASTTQLTAAVTSSAPSRFSAIMKKASQVASSFSQTGQFLSVLSQEESPNAMHVIDTLYLF